MRKYWSKKKLNDWKKEFWISTKKFFPPNFQFWDNKQTNSVSEWSISSSWYRAWTLIASRPTLKGKEGKSISSLSSSRCCKVCRTYTQTWNMYADLCQFIWVWMPLQRINCITGSCNQIPYGETDLCRRSAFSVMESVIGHKPNKQHNTRVFLGSRRDSPPRLTLCDWQVDMILLSWDRNQFPLQWLYIHAG